MTPRNHRTLIGAAWLAATGIAMALSPAVHGQSAGNTETVLFGSGLGPPYLQYMTAVDGGIMKKHGVNAEYKIFASGVEAAIAVGAGEAHVSNGSCSSITRAKANGSRFVVVARNILNPKEHKLIGAKGIDKSADLRGKKVGMLVGSSTDWYSTKYLKAFDLEEGSGSDAVELVSIGAPEWIPALQRGDIAAFFGWEPWVTKAQQIVDGAHVLHDGGEDGLFILMNCMVFNMDWIENDPESAEATMRGLIETHDVVQADLDAAVALASTKMRIPENDLRQMTNCCSYRIDFPEEFREHAAEAVAWAGGKGMLKGMEPSDVLKSLLYPDLLRKVEPDRVMLK